MLNCIFEDGGKGFLRHVTVDAIITMNNKLLLVRRASHLIQGDKLALPGGFLSRGETVYEGVIREVLEETGYKVKINKLFKIISEPSRNGEDRQNVEFIFLAKSGKKVSKPDDEVSEIKWFDLNDIPNEDEFAFDHYQTISLYLKYIKEKFNLPLIT